MFGRRKNEEADLHILTLRVATLAVELLGDLETHRERTKNQFRRIDDQLRQIHERLDRMEGIR